MPIAIEPEQRAQFQVYPQLVESLFEPATVDVFFVFPQPDGSDRQIGAHKQLLSAFSPRFRSHFEHSTTVERHTIHKISCDAFESFLQYFYRGSVALDRPTMIFIGMLGIIYDVHDVRSASFDYMADHIDTSNVLDIYQFIIEFDTHPDAAYLRLRAKVGQFIGTNTAAVLRTDAFGKCPSSVLQQVLTLDRNCTEATMFEACVAWTERLRSGANGAMSDERIRMCLGQAFQHIRFEQMDRTALADIVERHRTLFTQLELAELFVRVLRLQQGPLQTPRSSAIHLELLRITTEPRERRE